MGLLALQVSAAGPEATLPSTTAAARDLVRFRNGDLLFGKLRAIDADGSLRWEHPDANGPIIFKLGNVAEIQMAGSDHVPVAPTNACLVRLTNQDEISGGLVEFDSEKLLLDTGFAGRLTVPRKFVQFVQPRPPAPTPIYAGPTGLEGWTLGKVSSAVAEPGEWRYKNGAFYATRAASIARNLHMPDVMSLEFDLTWRGGFHLAVALYTDSLQPVNLASKESEPDFAGFYSLQLNNYYANLLPVTKLDPIRYLGQVPLQPNFSQKNSAHIEVRTHKAKNLVALLIDGTLVKGWVDTQEFAGKGTGIRIVHQGQGSSKISNLRVTEWDGQFEEKPSNPPDSRQDLVKLRNGDKLVGDLQFVREGKLQFSAAGKTVEVPLARVKQMELAGSKWERPASGSQAVHGIFPRGGFVTFELEKADDTGWVGRSAAFGRTVFLRAAFARVEFGRATAQGSP